MNRFIKNDSGQTLIEPLLAIAILAIILAPFITSLGNLVTSQVKYRHQSEAAHFAREGLEKAYNNAVNNWDDFQDYVGETLSSTEGRFTRTISFDHARRNKDKDGELDEKSGEADEGTIRVVSKVTWEEKGQPQEVEFTTYLIDLEIM